VSSQDMKEKITS